MSDPRLRLVTWNVWFGHWQRDARQAALWAEIHAHRPDVVCLQEVVPEHLEGPAITRLRERGWWVSDDHIQAYDVVMLSRVPVRSSERIQLPSSMGRSLLIARLASDPPLTVATVHLESGAETTPLRVQQLEQVVAALSAEPDGAELVLVGDMNFPAEAERPENRPLTGWSDVWAALHPDDPGYTIDTQVNQMRWLAKRRDDQRRIDRVFVRGQRWRAASIELLGTHSLPDDPLTFASDHLGLCVELVPGLVPGC